jgi:hypothetical protein
MEVRQRQKHYKANVHLEQREDWNQVAEEAVQAAQETRVELHSRNLKG